MNEKTILQADELLIAEYNYIAQTAFQANEDRSRVISFYLVSLTTVAAAVLSKLIDPLQAIPWLNWAFAFLFLALTSFGFLTIIELGRLRSAWFESIEAMNKIKDFYFQHFEGLELKNAFLWVSDKEPRRFKVKSISFVMFLQVAILTGIVFGISVFLFQKAVADTDSPTAAIIAGIAGFLMLFPTYKWTLK
jgi:hypothetical protein